MASVGDASGLRKASWISARINQTFVSVHESLLSETSVSRCSIFANSEIIGLLIMLLSIKLKWYLYDTRVYCVNINKN